MRRLLVVVLALLVLLPIARAEEQVWLRSYDGRGRRFDLRSERGRVVAIMFASRSTRDEAAEVIDALAARGLDTVTVVDFRDIPVVGRGTARKEMIRADRPGHINLVDERGRIFHAFGADPSRVMVLLVDDNGFLRGRYGGLGDLGQATAQADQLEADARATREARRASERYVR
jgi:hypothetical protein